MFGFENKDWKSWNFNGLEVLVPGQFNATVDGNGDTLIYPHSDLAAEPSGWMPQGSYFFDAIIRQRHFNEDHQAGTPVENIGAMIDAVHKFNGRK